MVRDWMDCGNTLAFVLGSEPPVIEVCYDPAGDPPGVQFFTVVFSDALPSEEVGDDADPVCAHCLLEKHPEAADALLAALDHGCDVVPDESGRWVPAMPPAA